MRQRDSIDAILDLQCTCDDDAPESGAPESSPESGARDAVVGVASSTGGAGREIKGVQLWL